MKTNNRNLQAHKFKLKIKHAAERIYYWILHLLFPPNQYSVSEDFGTPKVFGQSLHILQIHQPILPYQIKFAANSGVNFHEYHSVSYDRSSEKK